MELKNKNSKPNLDDLAFEGRNKEYGAYLIRKTYPARLFRSFIYSLCFFLVVLVLYARIVRLRSENYYYNSLQDLQVVGVNLSKNPYPSITIEQTKGASAIESAEAPVIVADEEIAADQDKQDKVVKPLTVGKDSTGISGQGTNAEGKGSLDEAGGGIVGEIYGSADINPQFPGGDRAMQEFIKANLHYPEIARSMNITGAIHIYFVIQSDGTVKDVKVIKGLQPDLDKETVRVIWLMPPWKPGIRGGVPVNVRCIIPITVSPQKYR